MNILFRIYRLNSSLEQIEESVKEFKAKRLLKNSLNRFIGKYLKMENKKK